MAAIIIAVVAPPRHDTHHRRWSSGVRLRVCFLRPPFSFVLCGGARRVVRVGAWVRLFGQHAQRHFFVVPTKTNDLHRIAIGGAVECRRTRVTARSSGIS